MKKRKRKNEKIYYRWKLKERKRYNQSKLEEKKLLLIQSRRKKE